MCVQITLLTPISAAKQLLLTYYMQRDGIVKSLEELIPQARAARNAHPDRAWGNKMQGGVYAAMDCGGNCGRCLARTLRRVGGGLSDARDHHDRAVFGR